MINNSKFTITFVDSQLLRILFIYIFKPTACFKCATFIIVYGVISMTLTFHIIRARGHIHKILFA